VNLCPDFSKAFVVVEIIYDIAKLLKVARSGGILLGIDLQMFDSHAIDEGGHYIKFHLCNKSNDFKWTLAVVYGQPKLNKKICSWWS
jgi:hypothetical protein